MTAVAPRNPLAYIWYIAGLLILISVFLFARDVSREVLATDPYTDVPLASN